MDSAAEGLAIPAGQSFHRITQALQIIEKFLVVEGEMSSSEKKHKKKVRVVTTAEARRRCLSTSRLSIRKRNGNTATSMKRTVTHTENIRKRRRKNEKNIMNELPTGQKELLKGTCYHIVPSSLFFLVLNAFKNTKNLKKNGICI